MKRALQYLMASIGLVAWVPSRALGQASEPPPTARQHVVQTRDGARHAGIVFEWLPERYLHLWLPEGRALQLQWNQIAAVGWNAHLGRGRMLPPVRLRFVAPEEPRADVVLWQSRTFREAHAHSETVYHDVDHTTSHRHLGHYDEVRTQDTHVSTEANTYRPLCTAPCSYVLNQGEYTFGLIRNGGFWPVEGERPIILQRSGTVELIYHSRLWLKLGIVAASTIAATVGVIIAQSAFDKDDAVLEAVSGMLLFSVGTVTSVFALLYIDPYIEARFYPDPPR